VLEPELDAPPELEPVPELEPAPELDVAPELDDAPEPEPIPEDDPPPELPLPEEDPEPPEDPLLGLRFEELLVPPEPAPPSVNPDSGVPLAHPAHISTAPAPNPKRRVVIIKAIHTQAAAYGSSGCTEGAATETGMQTASASFLKPL
jgi:hypothetical protein